MIGKRIREILPSVRCAPVTNACNENVDTTSRQISVENQLDGFGIEYQKDATTHCGGVIAPIRGAS